MHDVQEFRNYTKLFETYLMKIKHEYYLINQRVKFNTVIQSALLASYTFLANPTRKIVNAEIRDLVVSCTPWIGLLVTCNAIVGVSIALYAQRKIRKKSDKVLERWKRSEKNKSIEDILPVNSHGGSNKLLFISGVIFGPWPFIIFGFFWIFVLTF